MTKVDYTESDIQYEENSDYRQEFDPAITPSILSEQIQSSVDSIISQCHDADWNEDLITFKIVANLREILANYKLPDIVDNYSSNKFNFEAYKLTGKAEQTHGDIAVIITRKFLGKDIPISGVAFYEAKASSSGYRKYPSFCIQQLRRLVTHTQKLSYLIYNKEKQVICTSDWPLTEREFEERHKTYNEGVHAVIIDANFLKQYRSIEAASLVVGQSFGSHFVNRVLSGQDLDYSRSVDQTIRRWLKQTKKAAPLVISISIHEEQNEQYSTQFELPGFEKVRFPEIGSSNKHKLGKI